MPENVEDWREWRWTKLDWKRFWMHFPVGIICALLTNELTVVGVMATVSFLVYEVWECFRIYDLAHKDILGFLWGFIPTGVAIWVAGLII